MTAGVVNIRGKEYKTVAFRIADFREKHPNYGVVTDLIDAGTLVVVRATITDENGHVLATGYAEENREVGSVNSTSAVENAETSAVGRALAFLGFAGSEIASADEIANAIKQQGALEEIKRFAAHTDAVKEHLDSIVAIKGFLLEENISAAREAYREIPREDQLSLWRAPTKGSIWTTKERDLLKKGDTNE